MSKPLNEYFKVMLDAKRSGAESFVYKGSTYVKSAGKNSIIVYKKK